MKFIQKCINLRKITGSCPLDVKFKIEIALEEVGEGLQQESISCLIRAVPPSSIIETWKKNRN